MRNIEIKATVPNVAKLIEKVKRISGSEGEIIKQCDTFFLTSQGRLKLRKFESGESQLIFYERPDVEGPKMCSYEYVEIPQSSTDNLCTILSKALHTKVIVNKTGRLFFVSQTRIHIDSVENLGDFMELEVVLDEHQSAEDGQKIAYDLMELLEINKEHLISKAYGDLLTDISISSNLLHKN